MLARGTSGSNGERWTASLRCRPKGAANRRGARVTRCLARAALDGSRCDPVLRLQSDDGSSWSSNVNPALSSFVDRKLLIESPGIGDRDLPAMSVRHRVRRYSETVPARANISAAKARLGVPYPHRPAALASVAAAPRLDSLCVVVGLIRTGRVTRRLCVQPWWAIASCRRGQRRRRDVRLVDRRRKHPHGRDDPRLGKRSPGVSC